MIYKTLHWYIIREMLRIFLMTSGALTTLMAFGWTFKPFAKHNLELAQLLIILTSSMPAMLAYSIPISALFASVLVYWRMATDNELTACRAGGISFITIVMPAFILGLAVASVDLVFVNYVVPHYLQAAERAIMKDLAGVLVGQVGRQEAFEYGKVIVYANQAEQLPGEKPGESVVLLNGMAATPIGKDNQPLAIIVARQAKLTITDVPSEDSVQITPELVDAAGYDPRNFTAISGSLTSFLPTGKNLTVPSMLKTKPKFLNIRQLFTLDKEPYKFPPVRDVVKRISQAHECELVAGNLLAEWNTHGVTRALNFDTYSYDPSSHESFHVFAPSAVLNDDKQLVFRAAGGVPVRVEQHKNGRHINTYTCGAADFLLSFDDFSPDTIVGVLQLRDNVVRKDMVRSMTPMQVGVTTLSSISIPDALHAGPTLAPLDLLKLAADADSPAMKSLANDATNRIRQLFQNISSELNSRGSFALSCLTLVLLGAALGILMKGRNPLAVFVVGVIPAALLMVLITAGRQLAESAPKNVPFGIAIIWAGNLLLLVLVLGVYAKLLRQ